MARKKNYKLLLTPNLKDSKEAKEYLKAILEECEYCDEEEAHKLLLLARKNITDAQNEAWLFKPENRAILEKVQRGLTQKTPGISRGSFARNLKDQNEALEYLNNAAKDLDSQFLINALKDVVKAQIDTIDESKISIAKIKRVLAQKYPKFRDVVLICEALGFRIVLVPKEPEFASPTSSLQKLQN